MLKVYTSGSLLEDREILLDFQATVLRTAVDRGLELVIESRTEQLTREKLVGRPRSTPHSPWRSASKLMMTRCSDSMSTRDSPWRHGSGAVGNPEMQACRAKTYLMFKPPFMSEGDALPGCAAAWVGTSHLSPMRSQ